MNKKEIEIGEFEMHLKKFFVCALIWVIMTQFLPLRLGLKTGVENDFFWSVLPHQEFPQVNPQGSPSLATVL